MKRNFKSDLPPNDIDLVLSQNALRRRHSDSSDDDNDDTGSNVTSNDTVEGRASSSGRRGQQTSEGGSRRISMGLDLADKNAMVDEHHATDATLDTNEPMSYQEAYHRMSRILGQPTDSKSSLRNQQRQQSTTGIHADNQSIEDSGDEDDDDRSILTDNPNIRPRLPTGKVSPAIQDLMRKASGEYFQGRYQSARRLLLEIVRMRPNYPDPYNFLALIAEDEDRLDVSLKCRILDALLRNDPEAWHVVAGLASKLNNDTVRMYALKRIARHTPNDESILIQLARLYKQHNMNRRAVPMYEKLARKVAPQNAEAIAAYAHHLFESGKLEETNDLLWKYLQSFGSEKELWDPSIVNMMCELKNEHFKQPEQVLGLIREYADSQHLDIIELPADLVVNYAIALLNVTQYLEAKRLFDVVLERDVDREYHFQIANALFIAEEYQDAIPILENTQRRLDHRAAAIHLMARCYENLNDMEKAINYFELFLQLNPLDSKVRLDLSKILSSLGRISEAIDVLRLPVKGEQEAMESDDESIEEKEPHQNDTPFEPGLKRGRGRTRTHIPERTLHDILLCVHQVSFFEDNPAEYVNKLAPIYYACAHYKNSKTSKRPGLADFATNDQKERFRKLKMVEDRFLKGRRWAWNQVHTAVGTQDLVDIVVKLATALFNTNEMERAFFVLENLVSNRAVTHANVAPLKFTLIKLSIKAGKYKKAYKYLKYAIRLDPHNADYWSLLYRFIRQGLNHVTTFMFAILKKHPDCVPALLLRGHVSMISGVDVIALGFYIAALRQKPLDPLLNLCVAVAYLNATSRRSLVQKNKVVLDAFAYMFRYADNSKEYPMETNYNLGRAFHALNLKTLAMHYYNKVLTEAEGLRDNNDNLVRESAVNLARLYESGGNPELGRSILMQYVVI
uniref:General transcription factor 3C polypeptide 3 n=1 Tax=Percolomonas cosmopolitus TaxID=63605 RepID=A0A7S1KLM9_9EUKA|mmetsp:Transcript_10453/g.38883  ORF Transcript_10453/g.38883 Transcript_10453/m.38883 type:complete len:906 (+) Transcript_10453:249-2966(+)|eukprot:CAMPEP_0117439992 /NCGR_PEP_ID=MMETSP0759-20121206/2847_1 /TAXON_ID=63605 /ORGANISM="Percolomonas cosmopolitus, Strain WS" /LENGTH=905 /DNA_ID=CAMNT_0005231717 /DNA_START=171 /DNA_END=2888 /DNA_ORIENTATION=+